MSESFYFLAVAVYLGAVGWMVWSSGKERTLRFGDLLGIVVWPLDLVWPLVIAVVATLELCAQLAAERFHAVQAAPRMPESS